MQRHIGPVPLKNHAAVRIYLALEHYLAACPFKSEVKPSDSSEERR